MTAKNKYNKILKKQYMKIIDTLENSVYNAAKYLFGVCAVQGREHRPGYVGIISDNLKLGATLFEGYAVFL